jgi:peptidyl-dipeptidase Dcp
MTANHSPNHGATPPVRTSSAATIDNPLLDEWIGPFGGVPPFDRVAVEYLLPALDEAIARILEEVDQIANDPAPPTFQNTLDPFERSGDLLERVRAIGSVWRSNMNNDEFRAIEGEMMVKLADLEDRITQNTELFRRVAAVYEASQGEGFTPEQRRLVWMHYTGFVRSGAALEGAEKVRLTEINRRLAELSTLFDQNVLADENEQFVLIDSEGDLAGLPDSERAAAASAAEARGLPEKWLIANTRSAVEPFLTHSERRHLREQVWRMFVTRGDSEGERDNKPVITEILALRAERAVLLGYPTHAHWAAERQMAKTPTRAIELMDSVWPAAVARVREEVEEMSSLARADGVEGATQPWDYRYYAELARRPRADLDWDEVKPYLQLDRLRDGMFWVAGELFGLAFSSVDVPVYHVDVRAWEVTDRDSGRHVGLFYFDPFARRGKKSGAWMNHYRRQDGLDGDVSPIVSNNCNYLRARPGDSVLISWVDARTLFHEFGHALHGLLSEVTYRSLAGTSVPTDYVEFPSQLMEQWLATPEFLRRFAVHHRTGEPMPADLMGRIERAVILGRGFSTTEELASGLVDLKMHLDVGEKIEPGQFERATLAEIGMPDEIVMRHRPTHFGHIFSGDHYAAKYYSYLWADVLAADAAEAFHEAGSMYDATTARRLRDHVLARGNTVDPEVGYRAFRGRDPSVGALMRKRGFG